MKTLHQTFAITFFLSLSACAAPHIDYMKDKPSISYYEAVNVKVPPASRDGYSKFVDKVRRNLGNAVYNYYAVKEEGIVAVIVFLKPDGRVDHLTVDKEKTKASDRLIENVVRAIKARQPYPELPPFVEDRKVYSYRAIFDLRIARKL